MPRPASSAAETVVAWDPRTGELFTLDYGRGVLNFAGTVPFVAARIVHNGREAAQASGTLTSSLVLNLQVAQNILARPEEAVAHLLGLWPDGGAGPDDRGDPW